MAAPRLFEALSSCLSIKIGGRVDAYLPASMVRMCDRLSVEVSNWRRAFADAPAYYWYAKSPGDAQLYKRLG
jgi:3'-5' exoribonuclease